MAARKRLVTRTAIAGLLLAVGIGVVLQFRQQPASSESNIPSRSQTTPQSVSVESTDDSAGDVVDASDESAAQSVEITTPTSPADLTVEQMKAVVAGNWKSSYYGTRYLITRDDGTATIYYQASTFASMFVGGRLRIEYEWTYNEQEQRVVFTMTGGGPKKNLEYVADMWGGQQRQDVLTVCQDELHLRDLDGETEHRWKKIAEIPEKIVSEFDKL